MERSSVSFLHAPWLLTMKSRIEGSKAFVSSAVRAGACESTCSVGLGVSAPWRVSQSSPSHLWGKDPCPCLSCPHNSQEGADS